jgi:phage antirepressor YoqD-like protein
MALRAIRCWFTDAAKMLKERPKDLFARMQAEGWIYRRLGGAWIGYQSKVQAGYLDHIEYTRTNQDGFEKAYYQVRVTAKGMVRLAEMLNQKLH